MSGKFDWSSFLSNVLSVVLGIFITFGIQGVIDRRQEKKDVASALELVLEELIVNKNDLQEVMGLLRMESEAANCMLANAGKYGKCDADSLAYWSSALSTEYFFTVTDDALELLKSSSLFQKINDKNLALSIIKAYDYLGADSKAFNSHEQYKVSLLLDATTDKAKKDALSFSDKEYLVRFYSTPEAKFFLRSAAEMSSIPFLESGLSDINDAIDKIQARIK